MVISDYLKKFEAMVAARPNQTLVVDRDGERRTSMKAFWTMCLQLAAAIRRRQNPAGVGGFLPIVLSDGPEYFAAELAVWITGNAAVNLGHSFPKERVAFIREQCEAEFLLDEDFVAKALSAEALNAETFNAESAGACGFDTAGTCGHDAAGTDTAGVCRPGNAGTDTAGAVYAPRRPEQPCLMFYTSGSTGNPKGVLHSDDGICQCLQRIPSNGCLEPCRQYFMLSPCYFVAISLPLSLLLGGKTLHIPGSALRRDALRLVDYLNRWEIDYAYLTPSLLGSLKADLPHLRCVLSAGERMINLYSENYTLINLYGQTETFGLVCRKIVDKAYDNTPVGSAAPQLDVCLLDENDREVEPGAIGEFCIKGGLVPPVYFKDPERTAQLVRGGRLHTGDLMRQLPNGDFLYLQRKDWMLKINGQRVEPGEVEAVFLRVEGLKNALVKGFTTPDGTRQYMVGYYIADGSREITPAYLTEALSRKLPPYMVPTHFVAMDAFPLNANGKIDRQSLTPPVVATQQADYVAPETELQRAICEAFAKTLNLEKVGIDDDFFHLGGDSIRLMQLQQYLPAGVSADVVTSETTPRRIARRVAENADLYEDVEQPDYPLSQTQALFLDNAQKAPESTASYFPFLQKFSRAIDAERLCRAVETAVMAHPGLRVTLRQHNDGHHRMIPASAPYTLSVERLSDADMEAEKGRLLRRFRFFDEPLFFARVFETESAVYLYTQMHHVVTDGVSNFLFLEDIAKAYCGEAVEAEAVPVYRLNERYERLRNSPAFEEYKDWFQREFEGSAQGKDSFVQGKMTSWSRALAVPAHSDLEAFCQRKGITLNVLLMACTALAMDRQGLRDLRLSASFHGRTSGDIARTVGFVASPRVFRFHWEKGEAFDTYLERCKHHMMGNMARVAFTSGDTRRHTGIPYDFPIVMYQGSLTRPSLRIGEETGEFTALPVDAPPTRPLILFILDEGPENFRISLDYDSGQYTADDMETLTSALEYYLNRLDSLRQLN